MSVLLQLDAGDLLRRLLANIESVVLVLVFVALPILRGIFESRRRKQAPPGRAPAAPRPSAADEAREAERTGRELWEELLRGEVPEYSEPEPAPRPSPVPPAAREAAPAPAEPQFEPVQADVFSPAYDEERLAQEVARERLAAAQEVSLESAPPAPLVEIAAPEGEAEEAGAPRAAWFDLRRAVIASEVLGAPVALRSPGSGASFPPGLAW